MDRGTMKKTNKKWEVSPMGNLVLQGDGFFISYRANTADFGESWAGNDEGSGETALCFDGEYKILNGDFRKDYEKIIDSGLNECLKFYEEKKEKFNSRWTT